MNQPLLLGAGLHSSGQGMSASLEGLGEYMVLGLLGAFCGLLFGLLMSNVSRYFMMTSGRSFGGSNWAIYGALLGVLLFITLGTIGNEKQ